MYTKTHYTHRVDLFGLRAFSHDGSGLTDGVERRLRRPFRVEDPYAHFLLGSKHVLRSEREQHGLVVVFQVRNAVLDPLWRLVSVTFTAQLLCADRAPNHSDVAKQTKTRVRPHE